MFVSMFPSIGTTRSSAKSFDMNAGATAITNISSITDMTASFASPDGGPASADSIAFSVTDRVSICLSSKIGSTDLVLAVYRAAYTVTNAANYIGIAREGIGAAASGSVSTVGGFNNGQSGLTVNDTFHVAFDGTLTLSTTFPKVGRATSTTGILITNSEQ